MHITHLSLENFRNYGRLELNFPLGATLLHGENAQGKTNLLEALTYLATTRSPHAGQDSQMLNWDMVSSPDPVIVGRLTAAIATKEGIRRVQMRLIREQKERGQVSFRREALINGRKVRLMDMLGQLQVVLFLPEDVNLITGAPNMRRRYLNVMLCQIDRHYCRNLSQYNKVLEQRNATLRRLAEGQDNPEILAIFSERLVELGSQIYARRAAFFAEISRDTQRIHYEELTGGRESLRIGYLPRLQVGQNGNDKETAVALAGWLDEHRGDLETVSQRFAGELASSYEADIARGATNIGPHRDDWCFWINGHLLSDYGSRGQQRSAMLAMKMAEIEWMSRLSGETPILLLDEVLAELDQQRRELLLRTVQSVEQAILTATDPGMFSSDFLEKATSMTVSGGRVQVDSSS
ncbi:MAG: DNA replication/repair protein RecF [Chloroflexi bacterium]|jgi:DNA replication and repair protein RecF|nr:DNA replication/repair protein RecF [Chloroflexota bacterium]